MKPAVDCRIHPSHRSSFPEDRGACTGTLVRRPAFFGGSAVAIGWLFLLLATVVLWLARSTPVWAAGVVGTGNPESCTEAALDAALAGGGLVTVDCGPESVTITLSATKVITQEMGGTTVDGGELVTLSGADTTRIFTVSRGGLLEVQKLTIAHGYF